MTPRRLELMGGTGLYHPPVVDMTWFATYADHTNRGTPSTEPGVDVGCPRFSPLHAAASGRVFETFYGVGPATGRFITLDLDDGKRVRYLHLEEIHVSPGDRVAWGQIIGKTGATGYGEYDWSWNVAETGGSHTHFTVFPGHYYVFGRYATVDPYPLTDWNVDGMPTIVEIFHTPIVTGPDGNNISLAQFMQYAHRWNGQQVWREPLAHSLAKDVDGSPLKVPAGDLLRYEPAEHANTRAVVAKIATGDFDYEAIAAEIAESFPELDSHAFAVAAADEADRRERARLDAEVKAS